MERLETVYKEKIIPKLMERFKYGNRMETPGVKKVVVNMGLGDAITDGKALEKASEQLALITGQCPVITQAKKSIAGFKLRKGMKIGCCVTLRGRRMYAFLDRLFNVALPRVKDFRGLSRKGMDRRGNYSMGIKEQIIFPEIDYDNIDKIRGLSITIVTSAKTDEEGMELLSAFGLPFRN